MVGSMGTVGRLNIDIGASDKTKPGIKAAEGSLSAITKRQSALGIASAERQAGAWRRNGQSIIGTYSAIERAGNRAFGVSAYGGGILKRITAIGSAGAELGVGLAGAAEAGSLLAATLGPIGIAAAATAATIGAVAAATDKMVTGWARGVNGAKRLADTIGVSTEALQKFQGAGERMGIDPGSSAAALTGLSSTLNAAAYGTDVGPINAMARAGIRLRRKANGNADAEGMLSDIATAFQRQSPVGAQQLAAGLGIPAEAIPLFMQGGTSLSATMDDVGRTGAVSTQMDRMRADRWIAKRAAAGQAVNKGLASAGSLAESEAESSLDGVLNVARRATSSSLGGFGSVVKQEFAPAAARIERGGEAIERAARGMLSAAGLAPIARAHNNPGNMRPIGGGGFEHFDTPEEGIGRMARQIRRDQRVHGARNIEELIGGRIGSDGKPHWGWAPSSDHNNTTAYIAAVSKATGYGPKQPINLSDPAVLVPIIRAIITQENGKNPYSARQVSDAIKLELTMHGAPPGTTAKLTAGNALLISKTPVGHRSF